MMKTTVVAGALLLALSPSVTAQIKVFSGVEDRKSASALYYTQENGFQTHGSVSITYGAPAWKKDYESEDMVNSLAGQRWRFGSGSWTTLDTSCDLEIGGVKVVAGSYYLVLELTKEKSINLIVLEQKPVRDKHIYAAMANMTKGGLSIPLQWTKDNDKVGNLEITLTPDSDKAEQLAFAVRWGNHKLTTDVHVEVAEGS